MTLKQRLIQEWDARASDKGGVPAPLLVDWDGGQLACHLTALDQLACAFERLQCASPLLEQASMEELNRLASGLSQRLSYLLEPIHPIEIDQERFVVQMRSNPPHQDDGGTSYYELVVARDGVSLCRFTKTVGQVRRGIPAHVTREVFMRLAEDLLLAVKPK